jgi:hypothetical protein
MDLQPVPGIVDRRVAPRVGADGVYFRCRPVNPQRWWRTDGVIAWIEDLSATGARLRMHPNPEAKRRALWSIRVGRHEGEVEICNVSTHDVGVQGLTVGVRFLRLDPDLQELIEGYLEGTHTAQQWIQVLRAPA